MVFLIFYGKIKVMQRTLIKDIKDKVGETVILSGWVDIRRDHGKLIFVDLRDASGIVQMVVLPNHEEAHKAGGEVRPEWVVEVEGIVNKRPEKMVNADQPLGAVEIEVLALHVLNEAETPPFEISGDGYEIGEEHRLEYRYIDLRRDRMQKNLRMRHKVIKFIRDHLSGKDFIEVETPLLTKSTPEGARDYIVPARLEIGKFYALPQAPQQYKQILMASGIEKYFQIAKCLRDEDTRGDRQPEFTQVDIEASFVLSSDIIDLIENLLIEIVEKLYPEKKIQEKPFPRITYKEAMEKYGNDRPDIRENKDDPNLLAFLWVIDFPFFEKTDKGKWTFTHNPFSAPQKEYREALLNKEKIGEILSDQYDIVLNGSEVGGGSTRSHESRMLKKTLEIIGLNEESISRDFGHMLKALSSGAPPHGGIALGFDRLLSILQNEPNIREVIAFPKTGDGRELMTGSPSDVPKSQLDELGIEIKKNK